MMEHTDPASTPSTPDRSRTATIHPFRPAPSPLEESALIEEAGEMVAQAMATLTQLRLGASTGAARGLASTFELSRMIDTFLTIRDAERRRTCLAVLRSCAMADVEERGGAG